jgi:hypothetical protein
MSKRYFTPGNKSNSTKMINYIAAYNAAFPNSQQLTCTTCENKQYDKNMVGSDSPSIKVSNNLRISSLITSTKGGTTQFGNFYLGKYPNVNYLGRIEGMPGGSGLPPLNKF